MAFAGIKALWLIQFQLLFLAGVSFAESTFNGSYGSVLFIEKGKCIKVVPNYNMVLGFVNSLPKKPLILAKNFETEKEFKWYTKTYYSFTPDSIDYLIDNRLYDSLNINGNSFLSLLDNGKTVQAYSWDSYDHLVLQLKPFFSVLVKDDVIINDRESPINKTANISIWNHSLYSFDLINNTLAKFNIENGNLIRKFEIPDSLFQVIFNKYVEICKIKDEINSNVYKNCLEDAQVPNVYDVAFFDSTIYVTSFLVLPDQRPYENTWTPRTVKVVFKCRPDFTPFEYSYWNGPINHKGIKYTNGFTTYPISQDTLFCGMINFEEDTNNNSLYFGGKFLFVKGDFMKTIEIEENLNGKPFIGWKMGNNYLFNSVIRFSGSYGVLFSNVPIVYLSDRSGYYKVSAFEDSLSFLRQSNNPTGIWQHYIKSPVYANPIFSLGDICYVTFHKGNSYKVGLINSRGVLFMVKDVEEKNVPSFWNSGKFWKILNRGETTLIVSLPSS